MDRHFKIDGAIRFDQDRGVVLAHTKQMIMAFIPNLEWQFYDLRSIDRGNTDDLLLELKDQNMLFTTWLDKQNDHDTDFCVKNKLVLDLIWRENGNGHTLAIQKECGVWKLYDAENMKGAKITEEHLGYLEKSRIFNL